MTTITIPRAVVEQALEALERLQNAIYNIGGEHVTGLHVANDAADSAEKPMGALRAALAQQAEPLTIERLRYALVASRIIPPAAVEDPDGYDDGVTLFRIEALHRRIT